MKKYYFMTILIIVVTISAVYSFSLLPKKIEVSYNGIGYIASDMNFSRNFSIQLDGEYHRKSKVFQGTMIINDMEYNNCIISSGFNIVQYIGSNRYTLGAVFIDKNIEALTIEVEDSVLYDMLTDESLQQGKLILSAPAHDRAEAIKLNKKLKEGF